jgi:hypothetical protein
MIATCLKPIVSTLTIVRFQRVHTTAVIPSLLDRSAARSPTFTLRLGPSTQSNRLSVTRRTTSVSFVMASRNRRVKV